MEEDLTDSEKEELGRYLSGSGIPVPDEKHNTHSFLNKVATADDTTKVGNLKDEEIGNATYPARSFKNLALISEDILGNTYFSEYFKKGAEIITSTSLSRAGFLVRQANTTTRQIGDITKMRKTNKSWFKKKEKSEPEGGAEAG